VFHGVSSKHFRSVYYPVYRGITIDNHYGRYLFSITDLYKKNATLCKGMLKVVEKEQSNSNNNKILSSILWDIFTGNERYKNIFYKALDLAMHLDLWGEFAKVLIRRHHGTG